MLNVQPLNKHHNKQAFDCGNDNINRHLQQMASQQCKKGITQVHIVADGEHIQAFYTLSAISLNNELGVIKSYPKQVPAVLIGRLGVSLTQQGKGLASQLIANAMQQAKAISQVAGVAFVVIDAKTEHLAKYYIDMGFIRLPNNPLRLVYPISQI
ncbi:GNAT family N-acetyltransferase [Moraxella marmotae]|uniref:GNAT family N-acetyltransferase n=1 Tax=Moraxella marmotae TaxID=3344520 RepID=UPI0035F49B0D